jgi:hypothetical protein
MRICKSAVYGAFGHADSFETLKHGITASIETITHVQAEIEDHIDLCRITRDEHIEHYYRIFYVCVIFVSGSFKYVQRLRKNNDLIKHRTYLLNILWRLGSGMVSSENDAVDPYSTGRTI